MTVSPWFFIGELHSGALPYWWHGAKHPYLLPCSKLCGLPVCDYVVDNWPLILPVVLQVEELALNSMIRKNNSNLRLQTGSELQTSAKTDSRHKETAVSITVVIHYLFTHTVTSSAAADTIAFAVAVPSSWNCLPDTVHNCHSDTNFLSILKTYYFKTSFMTYHLLVVLFNYTLYNAAELIWGHHSKSTWYTTSCIIEPLTSLHTCGTVFIQVIDVFQAAEHTVNNQLQLDLNVVNPWHNGKLFSNLCRLIKSKSLNLWHRCYYFNKSWCGVNFNNTPLNVSTSKNPSLVQHCLLYLLQKLSYG